MAEAEVEAVSKTRSRISEAQKADSEHGQSDKEKLISSLEREMDRLKADLVRLQSTNTELVGQREAMLRERDDAIAKGAEKDLKITELRETLAIKDEKLNNVQQQWLHREQEWSNDLRAAVLDLLKDRRGR